MYLFALTFCSIRGRKQSICLTGLVIGLSVSHRKNKLIHGNAIVVSPKTKSVCSFNSSELETTPSTPTNNVTPFIQNVFDLYQDFIICIPNVSYG